MDVMDLEPLPAQTIAAHRPAGIVTPTDMMLIAIERGATLEQLERLYAIKQQFEKDEARKAFNAAFAQFKAAAVQVQKTKAVVDGPLRGKVHADLHDVVIAATGPLAAHGLSTSWRITKDEQGWIEVTCTLAHAAGHSESVALGGEPDTGPGRNKIQARGSTITYLERYTLIAILGLAAKEQDDDGRGGGRDQMKEAPIVADDDPMVLDGEREAQHGADALRKWWDKELTEQDRKRLTPRFAAMRKTARLVDSGGVLEGGTA